MIKVLHNTKAFDRDFGFQFAGNELPKLVGEQPLLDFEHVATVKTDDLDVAFRLTNHIDTPWHENDDVICVKQSRSTSVSDVMEQDGKFFVVMAFGFAEVKR